MDFKTMLAQLDQLNEDEMTSRKVAGKAYGGAAQTDDADDEDEDGKKKEQPVVKRGRGRPRKGADETGQVKKYEFGPLSKAMGMPSKAPDLSKQGKKIAKKHSLKEWVQEVENKFMAEGVPPGMKPFAILDPQNKQAGAGVLTSTDPEVQKMLGAMDPAKVKIMQTTANSGTQSAAGTTGQPQQGGTQPAQAGATGQVPAGQTQVKEKWAGDAEVKSTGEYTGKTVEQLKSMLAKLHKSGPHKRGSAEDKKMKQINFALRAKGGWKKGEGAATKQDMGEADIPSTSGVDTIGAGLGVGRSKKTFESKKKISESSHKHNAARLLGKSHALAKEGYNCRYDDMEEAKCYHEGYKAGLDECYGQMPIIGLVKEIDRVPATQMGMADQEERAMESDMEEGNAFTAALAKTGKGDKFTVGGKTFTDRSNYDSKIDEFAFESWNKELNALLTEGEEVNEGMSVSISKGQQGAPDSVTVSAQDAEAEKLLGLIKHAGLGLFGNEAGHIGADADDQLMQKPGGIGVVGDHDGMMSLIKKVTSTDDHTDQDYEDEEGRDEEGHEHSDEETCQDCGYMENKCQCDKEEVTEVESEDQMAYEVAEDNPPDSGAAEEEEEIQDTAQANASAADSSEDLEEARCPECGHDPCECDDKEDAVEESLQLDEWANEAGKKGTDAQFEQDIEFMTRVISGGLNKPKSTGQTTVPVIAGQTGRMEDPSAWARLAGIKK